VRKLTDAQRAKVNETIALERTELRAAALAYAAEGCTELGDRLEAAAIRYAERRDEAESDVGRPNYLEIALEAERRRRERGN